MIARGFGFFIRRLFYFAWVESIESSKGAKCRGSNPFLTLPSRPHARGFERRPRLQLAWPNLRRSRQISILFPETTPSKPPRLAAPEPEPVNKRRRRSVKYGCFRASVQETGRLTMEPERRNFHSKPYPSAQVLRAVIRYEQSIQSRQVSSKLCVHMQLRRP